MKLLRKRAELSGIHSFNSLGDRPFMANPLFRVRTHRALTPVDNGMQEACLVRQRPGGALRCHAWKQVLDASSGQNYWWNTATNETAWQLPPGTTSHDGDDSSSSSCSSSSSNTDTLLAPTDSSLSPPDGGEATPAQASLSFHAMLENLLEALSADGSGMAFWEAARSMRAQGVFDHPFTEFLTQTSVSAEPEERRLRVERVMVRLSNPLLKQPAPFEF